MTDAFLADPVQAAEDLYFKETNAAGVNDHTTEILRTGANKMAGYAAALNDAPVLETFRRASSELQASGRSQDVEDMKIFYENLRTGDDQAAARQIIMDEGLDLDTKIKVLSAKKNEILARTDPEAYEAFTRGAAEKEAARILTEERVQRARLVSVDEIIQSNKAIEELKAKQIQDSNTSVISYLFDIGRSALITGFGVRQNQAITGVIQQDFINNVFVGESIKDLEVRMAEATPEERVRMSSELIKRTDAWSTLLIKNDVERAFMMDQIISDIDPNQAAGDFKRVLNNILGVVDLVPGAALVTRPIRRGLYNLFRRTPVKILDEVSPNSALQARRAILEDDTGEVADAMGQTPEEVILETLLPESSLDINPSVSPDLNGLFDEAGLNFTSTEKLASQEETKRVLDQVAELPGFISTAKSRVVSEIPGGYRVKQTLQATNSSGFATAREAVEAVQDYLGEQDATITVHQRRMVTGEYIPKSEIKFSKGEATEIRGGEATNLPDDTSVLADEALDAPADGEFIVDIELDHIYNVGDAKGEALDNQIIGVSGRASKYLDKASVFDRWLDRASNRASDQTDAVRATLATIRKPFTSLGRSDKAKVLAVINEGDLFVDPNTGAKGEWFTRQELRERVGDDLKLHKGYFSVKKHQDQLYDLSNKRQRKKMVADGLQSVALREGGYATAAKPMSKEVALGIRQAWNPKTKLIDDLNSDQIEQIYREGGSIGTMHTNKLINKNRTKNVIVRKGDASFAKLPDQVLNKRAGHITKIYDVTHIVYKKITGVTEEGVLIPARPFANLAAGEDLVPARMSPTSRQANRSARLLNRENPGDEFVVRRSRELNEIDFSAQDSPEFFEAQGQMFYSKRGREIESVVQGERQLEGIEESLEKSANRASRFVVADDFINGMIKRWEDKFPDFSNNGRIPLGSQKIPEPSGVENTPANRQRWKEAVAYRDWINRWSGVDTTLTKKVWNDMMLWTADSLAGISDNFLPRLLDNAEAVLLNARNKTPLDSAKQLTFTAYIALNPLRQVILQAQQVGWYGTIEGGLRYMMSSGGAREAAGLFSGKVALGNSEQVFNKFAPIAAKAAGMSVDEYKAFHLAWKNSGLDPSLSNHAWVKDLSDTNREFASGAWVRSVRSVRNAGKTVRKASQKVGFEAGEYVNMSTAWLVVRNREIQKLLKEGKTLRQARKLVDTDETIRNVVAADARSVSLNMNRAGGTSLNEGAAGFIFQFMSHTSKAMQAILPDWKFLGIGKLASKQFTNRQKALLAISQTALYGVGGWGLTNLWEEARDQFGVNGEEIIDPVTGESLNTIIKEGLGGITVQMLFETFGQDDANLDFSGNFAPLSGVLRGGGEGSTPTKIVTWVLDNVRYGGSDVNLLNPPAWGLGKNIMEKASRAAAIWETRQANDLTTVQAISASLDQMARVLPVYSNFMKGRAELRTKTAVTSLGDPKFEVSKSEAIARIFLGMKPSNERILQDLQGAIYDNSILTDEGIANALRNDAKEFHKTMVKAIRSVNDGEFNEETFWKLLDDHTEAIATSLEPEELIQFKDFVVKEMNITLDREQNPLLISLITKTIMKNSTALTPEWISRVKNIPHYEGKELVDNWIDDILRFRQD